ncbi:glycoside hydrolase [Saccharophagus sp. K07]|jgi:oligosaccharide reducing-end xylanase|uniref:glycosyl hydrolase family 8 n=1 Tax=Saccharophagus sp. K07 TaxID=2283636 RepID=UPI001651FE0B|nr:glycosyl hydrolase family 8 [Saccharophagus sp. K07]MBC6905208.1 glycoside hydrolase [Saccharophagus sp. K07]
MFLRRVEAVKAIFFIAICLAPWVGYTKPEAGKAAADASGRSPNLLVGLGLSPAEIEARLEADYQQLFHGRPDDQRVFYPAGKNADGPLAYIFDVANEDVRSEGMSYGMMVAVQLDKKADFDALWNWSVTYMYHSNKKHPASGYFAWSLSPGGVPKDEMPAPDGEEYFATALYFAAARWGNGKGIYDYKTWADRILTSLLHKPLIKGSLQNGEVKSAGNLFSLEHAMVRFTPDGIYSERTDASYHLPAFYEVWARVGPRKDRDFWRRAAAVSRDYFVKAAHPLTGLTPDYGEFDGRPWAAPWRRESVDFRYDAWRTAMNWSMDWAWWKKDPRQQELSDRIQAFFHREGLDKYQSLYSLDGKSLGGGQSTALIAMNATASMAATHPRREEFVQALWKKKAPEGFYRYYDGMLYMLAMLNVSGHYRDWTLESR